jgi:hypothetical protein
LAQTAAKDFQRVAPTRREVAVSGASVSRKQILWPDFARARFVSAAHSPGDWFGTAQMLMSAAEAVKGSVGVQLMLSGFAFENIIKAIMVTRNYPPIAGGKLTSQFRGAHKLVELARQIGPATPDEETMLDWLSTFARWAGRYPIPVDETELFRSLWKLEWQVIASAWWESRVDQVFADGWISLPDGTRSGPPMPVWRRCDITRFPSVHLGPQ